MKFAFLEVVWALVYCSAFTSGNIHQKLNYFETLKNVDVHHVVKRSVDLDPRAHLREVNVKTLGKKFRLFLKVKTDLLSQDFKAYSIDGQGERMLLPSVGQLEIYVGTLDGDDNSDVHAYFEDDVFTATINTAAETYVIEPSWRHLPSANHTMISYRVSDINWNYIRNDTLKTRHSFCGYIREGPVGEPLVPEGVAMMDSKDEYRQGHSNEGPRRMKRQVAGQRNTCQLIIVADYKFHIGVGGGHLHRTASYLLGIIERVDSLYRKTVFDSNQLYTGMGFEIKEMRIHQYMSPAGHYNSDAATWDTKALLEAFSSEDHFQNFCLAHLFTYQRFSGGVLGLAYIASDRANTVGGICSPKYYKNKKWMSLNSGWTSAMSTSGDRILTQQADLVTAHEFGHNWGSEHDPDSDGCAPSSFNKGKYLMYPYSVSGYEQNNKEFSSCSRNFISAVLKTKSFDCFEVQAAGGVFCGNAKIETGEQCDGGFLSKIGSDPCCDKTCQLIGSAKCSPMNFECCLDCKIAPTDTLCRANISGSCEGDARCSGNDLVCPESPNQVNGAPCLDSGQCHNGVCQSFCEARSLVPCICDDVANACHRCCQHTITGVCNQYANNLLPNGRPCYQGYCDGGTCHKTVQDMVERFFSVFESITIDQLVMFMRSNIVGTIIVLSLVLWIPASCIISYIDKKKERNEANRLDVCFRKCRRNSDRESELSNFFRPTTEPSITHAKPRIISPDGNVVRVNDVGTREIVTEKETSF